jgi:apolipoprotein N-acyltransferase
VTAVINAKGDAANATLFSTGILKAQVELLESETFYVRFGDWFAWLATVLRALVSLSAAWHAKVKH